MILISSSRSVFRYDAVSPERKRFALAPSSSWRALLPPSCSSPVSSLSCLSSPSKVAARTHTQSTIRPRQAKSRATKHLISSLVSIYAQPQIFTRAGSESSLHRDPRLQRGLSTLPKSAPPRYEWAMFTTHALFARVVPHLSPLPRSP